MDDKELKQLTIRIEKNLYQRIEQLAKKENRNRNGQIEYMLKKYMEIIEPYAPPISRIDKDAI